MRSRPETDPRNREDAERRAKAIRVLASAGWSIKELSTLFLLSHEGVRAIVTRRAWRNVA